MTEVKKMNSPVLGEVEQVTYQEHTGVVRIEGWLLTKEEPWVLLQCTFEQQAFVLAQQTKRRDLVDRFPEEQFAAVSGFYVELPIVSDRVINELHCVAQLQSGLSLALTIDFDTAQRQVLKHLIINSRQEASHAQTVEASLVNFLESGSTLEFDTSDSPSIAVVIPTHCSPAYLLQCLASLKAESEVAFEIVVVDNAADGVTHELLRRVHGATILESESNLHYVAACNWAAREVSSPVIVFANDDVVFSQGALRATLEALGPESVGAVGGRIVHFDGRLQEAGNVILPDGSTRAVGRGESPWHHKYLYEREVDYCSGVFLATDRNLFLELDGFDARFAPAYYEDADYCVRVRAHGLKVLYEPRIIVYHREHASSGKAGAVNLQHWNREKFCSKHSGSVALNVQPKPAVLFIDDCLPLTRYGSGYPRTREILNSLAERNFHVALYCLREHDQRWGEWYRDIPHQVECIVDGSVDKLEEYLRLNVEQYSLVIVSRPQNLELLQSIRNSVPRLFEDIPVIYDAEAIVAFREMEKARLQRGVRFSEDDVNFVVEKELELLKDVSVALTVSSFEANLIETETSVPSVVLSHRIEVQENSLSFSGREGLLIVGPLLSIDSPNADAVKWFLELCLPLVRTAIPEITLTIVGECVIPEFLEWNDPGVQFVGFQEDVTQYYHHARVFVAATRFAAGIPLKVLEAGAHGLPVAMSTVLAKQLGWPSTCQQIIFNRPIDCAEALVALYTDEERWNASSSAILTTVRERYNSEQFARGMTPVFDLLESR